MTDSPIAKLVGILVVAITALLVVGQVWVNDKFVPSALDVNPIFVFIVAGLAVYCGFVVMSKFSTGIKSPGEFLTLIVAVLILYGLLVYALPGLGVIEKPAFALQSMISP